MMISTETHITDVVRTDARCIALAAGLRQLSQEELERLHEALVSDPESVVVDSCNFDVEAGAWCPLAVGLNVPELAAERDDLVTDADGKRFILEVGRARHGDFSLNPVSGIAGDFYTADRHADLLLLTRHMLDASNHRLR
jgi:hypothetical protein